MRSSGRRPGDSEVSVVNSGQSFREFEQAGWEDPGVVTKYHEHLSNVTAQSADALLDAACVGDGSRVLDVATGAGYVAGAAARRGADPIGIDFSAAQVRMARETYPTVRFEQADAEALPFEPDTFDAVVNAFGMCHLPNPDLALHEAFRVLRGSSSIFGMGRARTRCGLWGRICRCLRPRFDGRRPSSRPELLSVQRP
jgi:SAM-dependent methyltransferase